MRFTSFPGLFVPFIPVSAGVAIWSDSFFERAVDFTLPVQLRGLAMWGRAGNARDRTRDARDCTRDARDCIRNARDCTRDARDCTPRVADRTPRVADCTPNAAARGGVHLCMRRVPVVAISALALACASPPARAPEAATDPEPRASPTEDAAPRAPLAPLSHLPPDCSDPKRPCSEVGTLGDGLLGDELPPALVAARPTHHGTLDGLAVGAAIEKERARYEACGLAGSAVVRVVIDGVGNARAATFDTDRLTAGDKECLLRSVRETRFPWPGDTAEVLVPFVFRQ
jgi:hypothetical protein